HRQHLGVELQGAVHVHLVAQDLQHVQHVGHVRLDHRLFRTRGHDQQLSLGLRAQPAAAQPIQHCGLPRIGISWPARRNLREGAGRGKPASRPRGGGCAVEACIYLTGRPPRRDGPSRLAASPCPRAGATPGRNPMGTSFLSAEEFDEQAHRLYESGEYDDALGVLHDGLRQHPDSVLLHVGLGYVRIAREEYVWARDSFATALELDSEYEDAWVGLGETLLKFGRVDEALRSFATV